MERIAHLHVHSQYTLLGGTASVEELAARAANEGMPYLALTDTNALYGAVAFVRACRSAGIRPILGMAVTVGLPADLRADALQGQTPGRLVLLATGAAGYRSLCRLSSHIQGAPDRESRAARGVSLADLRAHEDGLICLSGGRTGWVERCQRVGERRSARLYAGRLAGIYGERTYLSLELHRSADLAVARQVVSLGDVLGLPTVAVQPVYCMARADAPKLRLLAAIDHNCQLDHVPAAALPGGGDPDLDVHWLSPDEMVERFAAFPDALARVEEIAGRCGPALPERGAVWPELDLPAGQTPDEALAELAHTGLVDRYGSEPSSAARERLQAELDAIARHGYAPLFLVVADIVRFARQGEIPVSTRGSVANSLAAYCTGITSVDPIAHDLLFERFLNPARADAPDIDLDLCSRRRDEVLGYVRRTYGEDRVSLVATVSTMRLRSAVRETAKAHGLDEEQTRRVIAQLPRGWHPDPRRRDKRTIEDVLGDLADPLLERVVREADGIVGQPHHLSVHPGGVVITPGPMTDVLPVQWAAKGFLITQFNHHDLEALGLPKIDLLGVRALTVLADAARLVRRDSDPDFDLAAIPLDDPLTAQLLARAETIGVFQCESQGARSTLRKLRAHTVRGLAVANAFFKPGPSTGGMARTFVRRYRGEEPVSFLHSALEPILGSTRGVLIFQEQILRVAREVAGLSWEQADHLRRGMSKFRGEEMKQMEEQFVRGCQRPPPDGPAFSMRQARRLWEQVVAFSGYGFNKGHATAYADVSYRSAYIKAHWPAAFLCARLADWGGFHHPAMYMAEATRLGIDVRPPHVNHSERSFALGWEGRNAVLWMGLRQVRDLRRRSIRAIVTERGTRPFRDARDLSARVPLQSREISHLIRCGALDGLGESRSLLLAEAEEVGRAGSALQMAFPFARESAPVRASAATPDQRLAWERRILGYPVSALREPLAMVRGPLPQHVPLRRLPERPGRRVAAAGVRLPGWTGGRGFHLWDGETWVVARGSKTLKAPAPWQPVLLGGRWTGDEWGTCWFEVEEMRKLRASPGER